MFSSLLELSPLTQESCLCFSDLLHGGFYEASSSIFFFLLTFQCWLPFPSCKFPTPSPAASRTRETPSYVLNLWQLEAEFINPGPTSANRMQESGKKKKSMYLCAYSVFKHFISQEDFEKFWQQMLLYCILTLNIFQILIHRNSDPCYEIKPVLVLYSKFSKIYFWSYIYLSTQNVSCCISILSR